MIWLVSITGGLSVASPSPGSPALPNQLDSSGGVEYGGAWTNHSCASFPACQGIFQGIGSGYDGYESIGAVTFKGTFAPDTFWLVYDFPCGSDYSCNPVMYHSTKNTAPNSSGLYTVTWSPAVTLQTGHAYQIGIMVGANGGSISAYKAATDVFAALPGVDPLYASYYFNQGTWCFDHINGQTSAGCYPIYMQFAAGPQSQIYTVSNLGPMVANGLNNAGTVVGDSGLFMGVFRLGPALFSSGGQTIRMGTLPGSAASGLGSSGASAVNNSGQIVGISGKSPGDAGFLYSNGAMTDLGVLPGMTYTYAQGINDFGQICGFSYPAIGEPHAFLYDAGQMQDLGTLGGPDSSAFGINSSGEVVGNSRDMSGRRHAFRYADGVMADLGALTAGNSYALAINNSGQVTGYSDTASGNSHAFLFSAGTMTDLGTPAGGVSSQGNSINAAGQIVGYFTTGDGTQRAFLYADGAMSDLTSLAAISSGTYLTGAAGINDAGQIAANGSDGNAYLLTPASLPSHTSSSFLIVNPFAPYAISPQSLPTLDQASVMSSYLAGALAADGESAVVLLYESNSSQPVTFALSNATGAVVGSLGQFDSNYLTNPSPPGGNAQTYRIATPTYGPDPDGNYTFLALLWGPRALPVPYVMSSLTLNVTATQQNNIFSSQSTVTLEPPPLLLIHGIWSDAAATGFTPGSNGFYDWIQKMYPVKPVPVDYGPYSANAFNDRLIQNIMLQSVKDALANAARSGVAARTVDVVAHSMGGLVARAFMTANSNSALSPIFLPNPIHNLITMGTPHEGTSLAVKLDTLPSPRDIPPDPLLASWCSPITGCTLQQLFANMGKPTGLGTQSLEPNANQLQSLSPNNQFAAIVGQAAISPQSCTETLLDVIVNDFFPGQSISSILGNRYNDTVVSAASQSPNSAGRTDSITISPLVHATAPLCSDTDEPHSWEVWEQAYYWLTGGTGVVTGINTAAARVRPSASPGTVAPVLNLSGYTQVAASNVSFQPPTGSTLNINSVTNITATSPAKLITEVLLTQAVADPSDALILGSTQSPFTISFTPARLGSTSFGAIAVFSDNTYAATTLNYTFQPADTPYSLHLSNAPVATMEIGDSRLIQANALSLSGSINVTQAATYTARSGATNVFSVAPGGTITATGNGVDLLDVSYGGVTATASIAVGPCTYALSPANQIVPYAGGTATIQVTTQSGCSWTAAGGAAWLPLTQASGTGNGEITLTAEANSAGGAQSAVVTLAGLQAFVTQPATGCSYGLSQTQINAPAAGAVGTIAATTACPVTASSDQSWLTATPLGSSVQYAVAPNRTSSQRSANLTIGSVTVAVTQAAYVPAPILQVSLQQNGTFWQAETGVTYTATVSNAGPAATSGTVTVTESLPDSLGLVSMTGSHWDCSSNQCSRGDALSAGGSYPAITVTVNVAANAPSSVTNQVGVSGGGSVDGSATELAAIATFTCDIGGQGTANVVDVQEMVNQALGASSPFNDLNHDGNVNVIDVQKLINAVAGAGCPY